LLYTLKGDINIKENLINSFNTKIKEHVYITLYFKFIFKTFIILFTDILQLFFSIISLNEDFKGKIFKEIK